MVGSFSPQRQRQVALGVLLALVLGLLALSGFAPAKATAGFGGFNATNGSIDATGTVGTRTIAKIADEPSGSTDNSYAGGGPKENDVCPSVDPDHAAPPKADIVDFYYGTDSSAPGVLYLAWTRKSATGTLTVDFELNKSTTDCGNGANPTRTQGDVLVTYDFQGGSTIGIQVRTWDDTAKVWVLQGDVAAAHEQSIAADQSSGELAIDLLRFHILDTRSSAPCTTFASGWAKTRTGSNGAFDTSTVKDFVSPVTTNISNCGSITVIKDARPNSSTVFDYTTSGSNDLSAFTLKDDGTGVGNSTGAMHVHPGSFTITESAEPGWDFASLDCTGTGQRSTSGATITATLAPSDAIVCTYVNTQPNTITIVKDASVATAKEFAFTATGTGVSNFHLVDDGTAGSTADRTSFSRLTAGTYAFTEAGSTGWALSGIDCGAASVTYGSDGHATFGAGDTRVNITLSQGDAVSCTYTNTKVMPTITVTKTANPTSVNEPGGNVTFAVHVANTSPQAVTITDLADDVYGDIADATNPALVSTTCATGASLAATTGTYDCHFTALVSGNAGEVHTDIVTATAVDADGVPATDDDDATVRVNDVLPTIGITKTPSATLVHAGDSVTYTYKVTNPGVEPLLDVTVSDDKCSPVTAVAGGDSNANGKLDVGETWTYTCTTALASSTTNVVTVRGHDDEGNTVSKTATATVATISSAITVKKTPDATSVNPGTTVVYTYVVTNPGDAPLSTVNVADDKCSPVTFVGGDTNGDRILQVGETWTYRCSQVQTGAVDILTNVATATGTDPLGKVVTSKDTVTVAVVAPEVLERTPAAPAPAPAVAPAVAVAPVTLPRTGVNVTGLVELGASLVLLGLALLGVTRRRRAA